MAEVTQTITLVPLRTVPFSGRPRGDQLNNIFPRARVIFQDSTNVTAKIAGNTNRVILNLDFPPNFYYAFDTWLVTIGRSISNDADNYETVALQLLNFEDPANSIAFASVIGELAQEDAGGQWMCWRRREPHFSEVFGNQDGLGPRIQTTFNDSDGVNATALLTAITYASFLQYDVMQADMVDVNAPRPVTLR